MTAPNYDSVLAKCIHLVASARRLPEESVTAESTFESLGADSLDMINLSFEVEESFDVQIPDDSLSAIRCVQDMAKGVFSLMQAKSAGSAAQAE